MNDARNDSFFVGYAPTADATRFALRAGACMLLAAFVLALVLGWSVQDRSASGFVADMSARGTLHNMPYPVLRIPPDKNHPRGRAILVAGEGKIGIAETVAKLKGVVVDASGSALKRGDLDMLVLDPSGGIKPAPEAAAPLLSAPVALGRFRIAGEICDGKCYAGAMRPGTGIAHKACANLCISGGQPAVLATYAPVAGASFILLANEDGGLPPDKMYDFVAILVDIEGELVRIDDLLVLRADWSKIKAQ